MPPTVTSASTTPVAPIVAAKSAQPVPESPGLGTEGPALRKAARVSVAASSTERGLFLVRVLEDGKGPPEDTAEGLLVLVDPEANVFGR